MKINRKEIINGLLLVLGGAWIWWQTIRFPSLDQGHPGPALFPRLISIGIILSGLILCVEPGRTAIRKSATGINQPGLLRLGLGVGVVALYPLLHPYLGFMPTLGIICFVLGLLLGVRHWQAALMAAGTMLFIFLTFNKLLGVSL